MAEGDSKAGVVSRWLAWLGENGAKLGIFAVAAILVGAMVVIGIVASKIGVESWKTVEGGRAILLIALTSAFVTFGGALTLSPLFEAGEPEERYKRAREVFLLFSGMFSTVVGFYFASATSPSALMVAASPLNATRAELQVMVAGGRPPYGLELEYGDAQSTRKQTRSLEIMGTAVFSFDKASDWPTPITVRVKDASNTSAQATTSVDKAELATAGFTPPKPPEQKAREAGASEKPAS